MPTIRMKYRVVAKTQAVQGKDPWGRDVVRFPIGLESMDLQLEEATYHALEVGEEYFCDFTPVKEGWLAQQQKQNEASPSSEQPPETKA